jgi:uracil-DNA glycosylase
MPKAPLRSRAFDLIPDRPTLSRVRDAARDCKACPLWKTGTQTVFGEGAARASLMLVGEQPGNEEDLSGHPFVGPAGKLLSRALERAGIDRAGVYVTNVVKHFKWEPRGKRRIHKKPNHAEVVACHPWMQLEIELVKPRVIVCLGSTAAQALIDPNFKVTEQRGRPVPSALAPVVMATVHPSSILRSPDDASRREAMDALVRDLRAAARALKG